MWENWTWMGEPFVLIPLSLFVALGHAWRRDGMATAGWLAATLLCLAVVAGVKVAGYAAVSLFELERHPYNLSGHAAFSTLAWGGAAMILATWKGPDLGIDVEGQSGDRALASASRVVQSAAWGAAALSISLFVAASRVAVGAHTVGEAVGGLAFGVGALALSARVTFAAHAAAGRRFIVPAALAATAVWAILIATGHSTEHVLQSLGTRIAAAIGPVVAEGHD